MEDMSLGQLTWPGRGGERSEIPEIQINQWRRDFPGGPVVKNLPSNAGDTGSIPG